MEFRVDTSSHVPPSVQLVDQVLDAVASGQLVAEARLPSVRQAAVAALVNPNTVSKAYKELERLGVVTGRNGSGVFVLGAGAEVARKLRRRATLEAWEQASEIALRTGHPLAELERLLADIATRATDTKESA